MEPDIKQEANDTKEDVSSIETKPGPSKSNASEAPTEKEEPKYFECSACSFREKYEYFGSNPPHMKKYILMEDAYVIEDPFQQPKQGKIIILGSHCIACRKSVCKDANCSFYYDGSFCIACAKNRLRSFPKAVQDKLNRIVCN